MIAAFLAGTSQAELARRHGVSRQRVHQILRSATVDGPTHRHHGTRVKVMSRLVSIGPGRPRAPSDKCQKALAALRAGASLREAARASGLSHTTVRRIARRGP